MRMRSLALALCLPAASLAAQDRPTIMADSYPVAWFAEQLAGDTAAVRLVVPEGRDPSSWRPTLSEIGDIQAADLIVLNGAGLADWVGRAALPRARTVDTTRGLSDRFIATETITHSHGGEGSHSHEGMATHTWLDLDIAAAQANALAVAMVRVLPEVDLDARIEALSATLSELDMRADALIDGAPVVTIASHPRYEYLGAAYGFEITSLDWTAGEAPDAEALTELAALVEETGAQLFIWETEPDETSRAAIAGMGLSQAVVMPLAMPPGDVDFAAGIAANLDSLEAALSGL